jgi:hypothetical protein
MTTEIEIDVPKMISLAKLDIAGYFARDDWMLALRKYAQQIRASGETREQSISRAMFKTDEGRALVKMWQRAGGGAWQPVRKTEAAPLPGASAWSGLVAAATSWGAGQKGIGSLQQAVAQFVKTPDGQKLKAQYDAARADDLKRIGLF